MCNGVPKGGIGDPEPPAVLKYDPRDLFKNVKDCFEKGVSPRLRDFLGRGSKNFNGF